MLPAFFTPDMTNEFAVKTNLLFAPQVGGLSPVEHHHQHISYVAASSASRHQPHHHNFLASLIELKKS